MIHLFNSPGGTSILTSQRLYRVFILLTVFLLLPQSGIGGERIPATDLIVDGQEIDLNQEKFHILFQELISANLKGRKGLVNWQQVTKIQSISLRPTPKNTALIIVSLEKDPAEGGGIRYIAGSPNFQAITQWNHSNRYAMAAS